MGMEPLSNEELGFDEILEAHDEPPSTEAPLWFYVLAEAKIASGGDHLGPVGSRIVAETLVGLIEEDSASFLTVQPKWTPTLTRAEHWSGRLLGGRSPQFCLRG